LIRVEDLHKSFHSQPVLDGVSLEIPRGEIFAIMGGSGEGKTVLLKHLIGLLSPDRGSIFVDGVDICRLDRLELREVRKKFGMLFQGAALFDSMSVGDNVAFPLREHTKLKEREIRSRVRSMLSDVGLHGVEGKFPSELSGGMSKRVGLARALALEPEIVLFDEPTTGLDPIMSDVINQLILTTQKRIGITFVIISHDVKGTFELADRIAMLHKGKIVGQGTPGEMREDPNPVVRQFLAGSSQGPVERV
jgi:phospholipid/cholesterol/gamma-HCH transport system ATP-binding protein